MIGKLDPHTFFVFGLIDFGPVLPSLPPKLFMPMTKNLFVFNGTQIQNSGLCTKKCLTYVKKRKKGTPYFVHTEQTRYNILQDDSRQPHKAPSNVPSYSPR